MVERLSPVGLGKTERHSVHPDASIAGRIMTLPWLPPG
jgi:hypothetical protein